MTRSLKSAFALRFSRTTANTDEPRTNHANDQNFVITFGPLSVHLGLHSKLWFCRHTDYPFPHFEPAFFFTYGYLKIVSSFSLLAILHPPLPSLFIPSSYFTKHSCQIAAYAFFSGDRLCRRCADIDACAGESERRLFISPQCFVHCGRLCAGVHTYSLRDNRSVF